MAKMFGEPQNKEYGRISDKVLDGLFRGRERAVYEFDGNDYLLERTPTGINLAGVWDGIGPLEFVGMQRYQVLIEAELIASGIEDDASLPQRKKMKFRKSRNPLYPED